MNLKFLNELAASNDRNFKFTALGSVGDHAVAAIALCTIKGLIEEDVKGDRN